MKTKQLSDMQRKAVTHVRGPAIVIAGPGSGKTFTVIQRILYLICNCKINPGQILTITFTKAAAMEMQQRYQKEVPLNPILSSYQQSVQFGTFHSVCYHILKASGMQRGVSLIKDSEKRRIMETLLHIHEVKDASDYDIITSVIDCVSQRKNGVEAQLPSGLKPERFESVYKDYEEMKKQRRRIDFDDMIMKCLEILREDPAFCGKWQKRFEYILVDEFQDINEPQYQVVKLLAAPFFNLFAVGDDDQSIYGFRGAIPEIMKAFLQDFPNAEQVFLTENYRSGGPIVELANQVIRENKSRFAKTILPLREGGRVSFQFRESRKEEELCLLSDIQKLSYEDLITSAVILRTNLEAFQYASLLKQNGVAVRQAGSGKEDVLHHFIMEDCLSFLRFCREGNRRKDFLRFMNKQNLFLSRQALLGEIVTKQELVSYYRNDLQMCDKINKLFDNIRIASGLSPALTIHLFRKIIGYDAYLKEKATGRAEKEHYMETADQLEDLFKLMKPQETCDHFFSRMEEGREEDAKKGAVHPGISVITMHGAKGLEFTSVFLPDLNEGVIPGKNARTPSAIEEERRLLYVAITRARDFLYLYCTRERNRKPTRFLERVSLPH